MTNQVMYVNKKEKLLFLFISISGVINLIFKILLVKFGALNPNTAILTTIMSNIILLLLEYLYIIKYLNINYDIFNKDFVKTILVCSLFIPINIIVNSANLNMIVSVILIVVLCISIYSIYLF
ncbi:polysaccharide biosynthesis C-terminal domain-containing protein, partial [uncultured Clostridium sp.]|uniref:polysaccharide biosynthesis C-terminal domain-containing protein n=1 Tax=uncultured Clostridium sp. TaxID=59620 RepID=UPI002672E23C